MVDVKLHIRELFENNIFSIDDVGRRSKPDPAIFVYSAQQLGVPPEECIVLEDSPYGIEAARRAGMKCIALTTTLPREQLQAADQIVNFYTDIHLYTFTAGASGSGGRASKQRNS